MLETRVDGNSGGTNTNQHHDSDKEGNRIDRVSRKATPDGNWPKFGGRRIEDVDAWLRKINLMYDGLRASKSARLVDVPLLLTDVAESWLDERIAKAGDNATMETIFGTWENFTQELKDEFKLSTFQQDLRQRIQRLRQQGSVADYIVEFRKLMGQVVDMSEFDRLHAFLNGLRNGTSSSYQPSNKTYASVSRG
jgi:hypothetical protein